MLALENWIGQTDLKVAEIIDSLPENLLSSKIQNANPLIKVSCFVFETSTIYHETSNSFSPSKIFNYEFKLTIVLSKLNSRGLIFRKSTTICIPRI